VADAPLEPGCPIMLGSMRTGRTCRLCDTGTVTGRADFTHAHPYLTGDGRWVIFNSVRTGVPQIYAASVPEGLLDSLE